MRRILGAISAEMVVYVYLAYMQDTRTPTVRNNARYQVVLDLNLSMEKSYRQKRRDARYFLD